MYFLPVSMSLRSEHDITMGIPQMSEPMHDVGKYVTVWQKQIDGSLKIKVETWNTDANPWEMSDMMHPDKDKMQDTDGRN